METYFCGLCHRFYVACCRYFLSKNYFKYFAKNVRWQSLFSAATTINASISCTKSLNTVPSLVAMKWWLARPTRSPVRILPLQPVVQSSPQHLIQCSRSMFVRCLPDSEWMKISVPEINIRPEEKPLWASPSGKRTRTHQSHQQHLLEMKESPQIAGLRCGSLLDKQWDSYSTASSSSVLATIWDQIFQARRAEASKEGVAMIKNDMVGRSWVQFQRWQSFHLQNKSTFLP